MQLIQKIHFSLSTGELIQTIAIITSLLIAVFGFFQNLNFQKRNRAAAVVLEVSFKRLVTIKIRNLGHSTASEISINWVSGKENLFPAGVESRIEPKHLLGGYFSLAPGQEVEAFLGTANDLATKTHAGKIYKFEFTYFDTSTKKLLGDSITFDVDLFSGVKLQEDGFDKIAEEIIDLRKSIEKLAKNMC